MSKTRMVTLTSPFLAKAVVVFTLFSVFALPAWALEVPFGAQQTISTAADGAHSVFAADVDGDGDMDTLSASLFDDTIAWYENDGTPGGLGDWTEHEISTTASNAWSVFAADIDGDGDMDALSASDNIDWYENTAGDGSAWTQRTISVPGGKSVVAADMDGDGDLDVLSDGIRWYENTVGDGSAWTPHTIATSGASSGFAADVDGDGDLDALSDSGGAIVWHENTAGDGSTWALHTISFAVDDSNSVFAADVDGDGDIDALSASINDDKIAWYENTAGDGSEWDAHTITTQADYAFSVFAADVDGDGDVDALSASPVDSKVAWYENDGTPGGLGDWEEHEITTAEHGAVCVFAADVDGDGDVDVLSASETNDRIAWYENGEALLRDSTIGGPRTITTSAVAARSVFAADVDGDGDVDALSASWADDKVAWYENTAGDGSEWTAYTITTSAIGAYSVFAADMDGDGDLDVLAASYGKGPYPVVGSEIAWYENDGTPAGFGDWVKYQISTSVIAARSVFAADVDGDGDLDALSASENDDKIAWFENDGTPGGLGDWTEHEITTATDYPCCVFAGDLDGDGDVDALSAYTWRNKIAWFENTAGNGLTWDEHAIATAVATARSVVAGDVDGDGDLDVLSADASVNPIAWYENRMADSQSWIAHTIFSTAARDAYSVFAADVDGDGDVDVLSALDPDSIIMWHENTAGDGSAWTQTTITTGIQNPISVIAADVDGDGDPDVLSASEVDDKIVWYPNRRTIFVFDETDWSNMAGSTQSFDTTAANVGLADELTGPPVPNAQLGSTLTFDGGNTGLCWTFQLSTLQSGAGFTFDDQEGSAEWDEALSVGDIDDYENDDFEVEFLAGPPLRGFGLFLLDNGQEASESYTVHGSDGQSLGVAPGARIPNSSGELTTFVGVITGEHDPSVDRVVFDEGSGGDDMALLDFRFQTNTVTDSDSDGVLACFGDCDDSNANCTSDCTDADSDGYCVTTDCDEGNANCTSDCTDADSDGYCVTTDCDDGSVDCAADCADEDSDGTRACDGDCDDADPNNWISCLTCTLGDGDLDLVVSNHDPNRLYLNNGTGSFGAGSDITSFHMSAQSIALGDVDGDGELDILFGNSSENYPNRLYLNDGRGNFGGYVEITADTDDTMSIVLGDVDGDEDLDLVAGNWEQANRLYLNNGTGGFGAGSDITADAHQTASVVLGDVDGDGDLDLVAGNGSQANRLYLNNGTGSFGAGSGIPADTLPTRSVALADVDGDEDLDLVEGNWGQANRLYLNNGTGSFGAGSNITNDLYNTTSVVLGDVDGDEALDLVAGNGSQANRLYLNNGTGSFGAGSVITSDADPTNSVVLGDVDGDGDLDLVAGNGSAAGEANRLYLNDGTGSFGAGSDVTGDAQTTTCVALGDLDGDGDGFYTGCDAYVTIPGPDCDAANPHCTSDCTTDADGDGTHDCADSCVDADGDGYGTARSPLPAPSLALANVPEAAAYSLLYTLDIPATGDLDWLPAVPYSVDNGASVPLSFDRVAYMLELNDGAQTQWVWVSMDAFTATPTELGVPHQATNDVKWQQLVTNMNVYASSGAAVTTGTGITTGNVEIWHHCYSGSFGLGGIGGSSELFDWDDSVTSEPSCFGSFQVHNWGAQETVLSYCGFEAVSRGTVGIGNQPQGQSDWTFADNAGLFAIRRLHVLLRGTACASDCDETSPDCTADCTDADSDGICVTHDCDDGTASAGSTLFAETITAPDGGTLAWTIVTDVRWCKGDLAGMSTYSPTGAGSVSGATSLDISGDAPASGGGMYYLVREQGCGSWQTALGEEPGRDADLPLP